ncbi:hypothetical protein TWF694_005462 [Orbilia ellipsospora]|uniref:NACHT domain-containing protein n=1 Tax=Orbilia ellipsospora TaxID=2528407 RepID=A0AAV9WVA8_9PEZI
MNNEFKNYQGQVANQANSITYNGPANYYFRSGSIPEEEEKFLKWLEAPSATDHVAAFHDNLNIRQPGTGELFLSSDEYNDWLSRKEILLCLGMPGAGKTIFASTVIDDLATRYLNRPEIGIAFIYFNYKRTDEQQIDKVLCALLKQLVQKQDSIPGCIKAMYNRHRGQNKPSRGEILAMLHDVVALYTRVFFVLDAIDEYQLTDSGNDGRLVFLDKLFEFYSKANINILATSRPSPDIITELTENGSARLEIRASDEDVKKYLKSLIKMSGNASLKRHQETIMAKICQLVDGMFLLAKLYFEAIKRKLNLKAVNGVLETLVARREKKKLANGVPWESAPYDSAYEDTMARIDENDHDAKLLAHRTLGWIICAKRPLNTTELQHALAVEFENENEVELDEENISELESIIAVCAGLVTIDQESDVIRLVHYTTQEFFERTWQQWFPDAHRDVTLTCLKYMSYDTFRLGPSPEVASLAERLNLNPLYYYAVENWANHVRTVSGDAKHSVQTTPLVQKFLQDKNLRLSFVQVDFMGPVGWGVGYPTDFSELHVAAYLGLIDLATALIEAKADIEAKDNEDGQTPLAWAAKNGHQVVVQLLIEAGANIDPRDYYNKTPLLWAAERGHQAAAQLLLEAGADTEAKNERQRQTPLLWAAERGYQAVVRLLIKAGANIETKNDFNQTPLSRAAQNGYPAVVQLLIEAGANIDSKDGLGRAPLSWAAEKGHHAAVQLLIEAGADIETKIERDGQTPLLWAAQKGHQAVVQLLIEAGADIDVRSTDGRTPLSWAAEKGHQAVVQFLIEAGANIDPKYGYGQTPLSLAAEEGYQEVVQLLVGAGAGANTTK